MRANEPLPTARTLLRWSLGAVFVALGVLELFCTANRGSIFGPALKVAVGLVVSIGPDAFRAGNLRLVARFLATKLRRGGTR